MPDSSTRILELGNSTRGFADRREPFTGDADLAEAGVVVMHFAELGNLFAQLVGQDKEAAWPRVQAGMKRLEDYLEGGGTLIAVPVATSSAYYGAQPYVKELIGWAQRIIGAEPKHKTGQQVIAGDDPAYRAFFEKMGAALYHTMYLDNPGGPVGLMVPEGHECLATHRWVGENGLVLALPEVKNPEKRREYVDAAVALTRALRDETGRPAATIAAGPAVSDPGDDDDGPGIDVSEPSDRSSGAIGPLERLLHSVRAASRTSEADNDDDDETDDDLGAAPALTDDEAEDDAPTPAVTTAAEIAAEIANDEADVEAQASPPVAHEEQVEDAAPEPEPEPEPEPVLEADDEEEEPLELTEQVAPSPPPAVDEDDEDAASAETEVAEELPEADEPEEDEPEEVAAEADEPVPEPPSPSPPPANDDRAATMTTVERSARVEPLKHGPRRVAAEDWSDNFLLPADAEIAQSIMAIEEQIAALQTQQKQLRQQIVAGKHRKALIAAQGDGFAAAAREAFEELGYKVERAGNGDNAFLLNHASSPDRPLIAYCNGSVGAIADREVIARLLHLEAAFFATHGELPKMLAVLNGHAGRPLDARDLSPATQFGDGLVKLGTQRGWCVMSGLQLMGMTLAGEQSPERREELAGQVAGGSGPLDAFEDWTEFLVRT
ncbi:MAG: hypothetical protein RIM84_12310 [Alphaproteobacteria bacterium]